MDLCQPPSGGCVLKPTGAFEARSNYNQPPSGGCVLKPRVCVTENFVMFQPPSGGCVLKLAFDLSAKFFNAASRLQAAVC